MESTPTSIYSESTWDETTSVVHKEKNGYANGEDKARAEIGLMDTL